MLNDPDIRRAAFLDRDGTIIADIGYLDDPEDIDFIPGAAMAIRSLNEAGIAVIILSNQSGVARGFFSIEKAREIETALIEKLKEQGALVDASYFCPHHPEGKVPEFSLRCRCRKPLPGMAETAATRFNIDMSKSWVIGDKASDIGLAKNIGAEALLVRTGVGKETETALDPGDSIAVFDTISEAVNRIIETISKEKRHA